jgi:hypothetical protein
MRLLRGLVVLGLVAGLVTVAAGPARAGDPVTGTSVAVPGFRDLEFDSTTDRLFVSDGDVVRVFDESGTSVATIPNMFGVAGIAISGPDVYVALTSVGKIARITAATAEVAETYTIGRTIGDSVAVEGGRLWFSHGSSTWESLGSLDLATGTPTFDRITNLYAPLLRTSASRPGELFVGERGLSPANVQRWNVAVTTPTRLARTGHNDVGSNLRDYALSPDGSVFWMSTGSPYRYPEVDATSLVPNGVIYPGVAYPNSVGVGSELVAFGSDAYYDDDVRVYRQGEPVALLTYGFGRTLAHNGLAMSDDDTMLYAVVDGSLWFQSLVPESVPFFCYGTDLVFTGTASADDLTLGQPAECPDAAKVDVALLDGADYFTLVDPTYPGLAGLTVDMGSGADTIAGTSGLVHRGNASVVVDGGGGLDSMTCCTGTDESFAPMVVARGAGFWLTDLWTVDAPVRVDGVEILSATTTGTLDTYTNPVVGLTQMLHGSGGALVIDSRGVPIVSMTESSITFSGRGSISWDGFDPNAIYLYDGRLVDYIDGIYLRLLGRYADDDGLWFWYDRFAAGDPRASLTAAIIHSPESAALRVDELYDTVLRRAPDGGGRAYWAGQIVSGGDLGELRPLLYASPEYFSRFGQGSNAGFIDALYRDILHRAPDSGGRAFWIGRLDAGVDRGQLVVSLLGLDEPRQALVDDMHVAVLGRHASAGERSFWVQTLVNEGEFVVLGELLASQEFYDLAAPIDLALATGADGSSASAVETTGAARPVPSPRRRPAP